MMQDSKRVKPFLGSQSNKTKNVSLHLRFQTFWCNLRRHLHSDYLYNEFKINSIHALYTHLHS